MNRPSTKQDNQTSPLFTYKEVSMKKTHLFGTLCACLTITLSSFTAHATDKVVVVPLGGRNAKIESKTFTKNFPAGEFRPDFKNPWAELGYTYFGGQGYRITNLSESASSGITTALDLADGSKILGVTCFIQDNDADLNTRNNTSVKIYRREFTSTTAEEIISPIDMTTAGQSTTITAMTSSSITYPIIENDTYFYVIRYFVQLATNSGDFVTLPISSDITFYGCSISYSADVVTM